MGAADCLRPDSSTQRLLGRNASATKLCFVARPRRAWLHAAELASRRVGALRRSWPTVAGLAATTATGKVTYSAVAPSRVKGINP